MSASVVKSIVLLMVLAVFSVLIGSQTADSISDSLGAFIVIGVVVGAFFLLWLGEKSWQLMYYIPAALVGCPFIPGKWPTAYAATTGIFLCSLIMWGMGHMKLRWRTVLFLDLPVLVLSVIMIVSFIRFPVSINALKWDTEYIGGAEYVWFMLATCHYLGVSSMGRKPEELFKVLKHALWLLALMLIPYTACGTYDYHKAVVEQGVMERYLTLATPATYLFLFVYASAPAQYLLRSGRAWGQIIIALVLLAYSGGREHVVRLCASVAFLAVMKRELTFGVCALGVIYIGLLTLSSQHVFLEAPHGVQRVLTMVPGVEVEESVAIEAKGSSNTRKMIWSACLDPRTGLLNDYVFGDGFGYLKSEYDRENTAAMRGTSVANKGSNRAYGFAVGLARSGSHHNGWITVVKRLGLVGLLAVNILFVCGIAALVQVSRAYRGSKMYPYMMTMSLPFVALALTLIIGTKTVMDIFAIYTQLGYIKMLYCAAKDQGRLQPLFLQPRYVPMLIREDERGEVA